MRQGLGARGRARLVGPHLLAFPCLRGRYDEHHHKRFAPGTEGRPFAYFVLTGGRFLYASAARLAVLKIVLSLSVSASPWVRHPAVGRAPASSRAWVS